MRYIKGLTAAAALALAAGLSPAAQAELITAAGPNPTEFDVFASCSAANPCNGGSLSQPVSAEAQFSNFVFSSNNTTLTFTLTLSNTTAVSPATAGVDLTAFGFNTSPDGTSVTATSTLFNVVTEQNFPGFNTVDICDTSGTTCEGGANGGLFAGQAETFTMTINGISPAGSIDLGTDINGGPETFDFKIAGSLGSVEFSGSPCVPGGPLPCGGGTVQAPEPSSIAALGGALVLFGIWWRRRASV